MRRLIMDTTGFLAEDWVILAACGVLVAHFALGCVPGVELDLLRSGGIKL